MQRQISRSEGLSSIPPRKLAEELEKTLKSCEKCNVCNSLQDACERCRIINLAKKRYADSNIPIRYWNLKMDDFQGNKILLDKYNEVASNLSKAYDDGICICFAGPHGVGKTLTCTNILKAAVAKGYQCLYTTLSDIVSNAVSNSYEDKFTARKELMMVDFLVIDEFDPRHMTEGASSDLFGRQMEDIFRKRSENKLPLFMCTNSPNVIESFDGAIRSSIDSLMSFATVIPVIGKDFRKK